MYYLRAPGTIVHNHYTKGGVLMCNRGFIVYSVGVELTLLWLAKMCCFRDFFHTVRNPNALTLLRWDLSGAPSVQISSQREARHFIRYIWRWSISRPQGVFFKISFIFNSRSTSMVHQLLSHQRCSCGQYSYGLMNFHRTFGKLREKS